MAAATDTAHRTSRMPDGEMEIIDGFRDKGAHSDHREAADRKVVADHAAGTDRGAGFHQGRQCVLVRL